MPTSFVANTAGGVYVTPFEDYQVFAYALDGLLRWALQVDWPRQPIAQIEIDFHMDNHRRRFPDRTANQIDWPDRQYALADIRLDG